VNKQAAMGMIPLQELKRLFSTEQALLILFARLYFSTTNAATVAHFITEHDVDWEKFYKLARVHGMRPFTWYIIDKYALEAPAQYSETVKEGYKMILLSNKHKLLLTEGIVKDLAARGITVIPYKGAVFTHRYYESAGLREIADIDLLVSPGDVPRIEDYFIENGYLPRETVPRPFLKYYTTFFKEIVYSTPATGVNKNVSIDLHWRMTNRFAGKFPGHDFFVKHLELADGSCSYPRLRPEHDLAVMLSNHFVKDMFIKFKYLVDIGCFFKKYPDLSDEHLVFKLAKKYKFEKRLKTGLVLINQLLGISPYPKFASANLSEAFLKTPLNAKLLLPRLQFNEPAFLKRSITLQDNFFQQCKFVTRCFLFSFIPTYIDIKECKLPVYALPALFIIRPFRLLSNAGKLKTIAGNEKPQN
jgi:hypothetical protein